MNQITKFAVKYPVTVLMLTLAICLLGVISYNKLGTDLFPDLKNPALYVELKAGERPPEEMEKQFVKNVEALAARQDGVKNVSSSCRAGAATITVEYDWDQDMDAAFLDLQRNLSQIAQNSEVTSLNVSRYDANATPVMIIALRHSEIQDMNELRKIAENYMRSELVRLDGVADIQLNGQENAYIEIKTDPYLLEAFNLTVADVASKIESVNRNVSGGTIVNEDIQYTVKGVSLIKNIEDIGNIIVAFKEATGGSAEAGTVSSVNGASNVKSPVYLRDIGYVQQLNKEPDNIARFNGDRCLGLSIYKENKYNTVKAVDNIRKKLDELQKSMPGYHFDVISDQGEFIGASIGEVKDSAVMGILLAVIILYVFLRRINTTLIVSVSIPISIIATFNLMYFNGLTLNIMTLGGLALGAGMLVDNAIVVTDNAQVAIRRGISRREALIRGATIPQWGLLGATLIAIFSFLPLYLAPSAVAEIVKPLFVVLAVSLGLSWVLALTQTTTFGNFILKDKTDQAGRDPYDTKFYNGFSWVLIKLIRFKVLTVVIVVLLFIASLVVMGLMPQNFFPNMDKPYFRADCFLPEGYSIRESERMLSDIERYLLEREEVVTVSTTLGGTPLRYYLASTSFGPKPNFGNILIELKDKKFTMAMEEQLNTYVRRNYPDMLIRSSLFKLSPAVEAAIEIGFIGENIDALILSLNSFSL